jgi:hypothetical protein
MTLGLLRSSKVLRKVGLMIIAPTLPHQEAGTSTADYVFSRSFTVFIVS